MHHRQAGMQGVGGCGETPETSVNANGTGIRLQQAEGNAHQGRLAGAVLAEQGMNAVGPDRERCVAQGPRGAEMLVDPVQAEDRFGAHRLVGASMNVQGMRNVSATCAASARTPSVSVA